MRELNAVDLQRHQRLSDEQILEIFARVRLDERAPSMLAHYGQALRSATRMDFRIMRPTSLILIAKYHLAASAAEGANDGNQEQRRAG